MRYSIIDVENEVCELRGSIGKCELSFGDIACWRIGQMLREVSAGSKLRNARIVATIHQIEEAIKSMSDSKNKKILKDIIQCKKKEIKTFESQNENLTLDPILYPDV